MPAVTRKKTRRGGANGEEEDVERMPSNIQLNCKSIYKSGDGQDISWKNYLTLANTNRAHAGFEDFSRKEITFNGIYFLLKDVYPEFLYSNSKIYDIVEKSTNIILSDIKKPLFSNISSELVTKMHTAIDNFFRELQSMDNNVTALINKRLKETNLKQHLQQQQLQQQLQQQQLQQQQLQQQQEKEKFEIPMPDGWPVMLDLYFFYKQDPRYREISKNLLRVYQMTVYLKYNQNLDYSLTNDMREQANQNLFDEMLNDKCLESYTFTKYVPNGNTINAIKKKCREKYLVDNIVKPAYTKDTPIFKDYLKNALNKIYNRLF